MKLTIPLTSDDRTKLLEHGLIDVTSYHNYCCVELLKSATTAASIVYDMLIYGYVADNGIFNMLTALAPHELTSFWSTSEPLLKARFGNLQSLELYDEAKHRAILDQT